MGSWSSLFAWSSWFPPSCPCDPAAKAWIEQRLEWLSARFENTPFAGGRLVLPTDEFFPDPYDGSRGAAELLFGRVCDLMGVARSRVVLRFDRTRRDLHLIDDAGHALPGAAGTYSRGRREVVRLHVDELADFEPVIGTMAHELAHSRLLGAGLLTGDEFDHELLTDLTAVFLGFGVFLANSPRNWRSQYSLWPGTELNKPEYMTPPMYGYALAHLAWFQDRRRPDWAGHLHANLRPYLRQGTRFLFETGRSDFRPDRLGEAKRDGAD